MIKEVAWEGSVSKVSQNSKKVKEIEKSNSKKHNLVVDMAEDVVKNVQNEDQMYETFKN